MLFEGFANFHRGDKECKRSLVESLTELATRVSCLCGEQLKELSLPAPAALGTTRSEFASVYVCVCKCVGASHVLARTGCAHTGPI